jgi:hypothetical protein
MPSPQLLGTSGASSKSTSARGTTSRTFNSSVKYLAEIIFYWRSTRNHGHANCFDFVCSSRRLESLTSRLTACPSARKSQDSLFLFKNRHLTFSCPLFFCTNFPCRSPHAKTYLRASTALIIPPRRQFNAFAFLNTTPCAWVMSPVISNF